MLNRAVCKGRAMLIVLWSSRPARMLALISMPGMTPEVPDTGVGKVSAMPSAVAPINTYLPVKN